MVIFLSIIAALLIVGIIMRFANPYPFQDNFDDHEETHVTTTTTTTHDYGIGVDQNRIATVGNLNRIREGNQFYVIDPADHDRVYVNDKDDMYEDGSGAIWNLV